MTSNSDDCEAFGVNQRPLDIALVDDHELLLGGLSQALSAKPWIGKIAPYQSPSELISDLASGHQFDLVISDLLMGNMNGLALAQELRSRFDVDVLLISGIESPPQPEQLARYGIRGFVHKAAPIDVLEAAIIALVDGETYYNLPESRHPDNQAKEFGVEPISGSRHSHAPDLSERQIEVLRLVSAGASNKDIAQTLKISENTVKTHMKHIFVALGVTKRTACVRAAKLHGFLE